MLDRYKREIDYLRISLTDNCNLRCVYCMPEDVKFKQGYVNDVLGLNDYKFFIKNFADLGIKKIRFTGGETLLYPHLNELIKYTYEECNINNIAITTNGIGLYEVCDELYKSGLRNVNISLDSLKAYKYKAITRGGDLKEVIRSITKCLELGIKVKINCVLMNDFNTDEINDFIDLTKNMPIDMRFIELMPIGQARSIYRKSYISTNEVIKNIPNIIKYIPETNGVADYYKLPDAKGKIGIISPMSCSFCNQCNRIRLTSNGKLKLCLHSKEEIDLKEYINKPMLFKEYLKELILDKPQKHNLIENESSDTLRLMSQIGG